jgi:hypothetical protein
LTGDASNAAGAAGAAMKPYHCAHKGEAAWPGYCGQLPATEECVAPWRLASTHAVQSKMSPVATHTGHIAALPSPTLYPQMVPPRRVRCGELLRDWGWRW